MRHKRKCTEHNGRIATCEKCHKEFRVQEIVGNALNCHLGKDSGRLMAFPDTRKRLDQHVYEMHKNFDWTENRETSQYDEALHYFASNALVNVHLVQHANRCFKKGAECYANLPDGVSEKATIVFNGEMDQWSDCLGHKEPRYMFRFYPKRPIEDVFMNTHSPSITKLVGCNSNVMVGMNGCAVFYVTGYNVKSTQKEEREAYEKISQVIVNCLRKREEVRFSHFSNSSESFSFNPFLFYRNRMIRPGSFFPNTKLGSAPFWQASTPTLISISWQHQWHIFWPSMVPDSSFPIGIAIFRPTESNKYWLMPT